MMPSRLVDSQIQVTVPSPQSPECTETGKTDSQVTPARGAAKCLSKATQKNVFENHFSAMEILPPKATDS